MLLWTYSPELLEQIARQDWQESGCIEESLAIQQSYKLSDEENDISMNKRANDPLKKHWPFVITAA